MAVGTAHIALAGSEIIAVYGVYKKKRERRNQKNEKKSNVTAHGVGNDLLPAGDHGHGLGG